MNWAHSNFTGLRRKTDKIMMIKCSTLTGSFLSRTTEEVLGGGRAWNGQYCFEHRRLSGDLTEFTNRQRSDKDKLFSLATESSQHII